MSIPPNHISILHHLNIASPRLIASGINSAVYELDDHRVVKISDTSPPQISELPDLLRDLNSAGLPFETPLILDHGEIGSTPYTIERKISGKSLRAVFQNLDIKQRERAIHGLLDALDSLHSIKTSRAFGDRFVVPGAITALSWSEYLTTKARSQYQLYKSDLVRDEPQMEAVFDRFMMEVALLKEPSIRSIVHGDLFFPNVMALDDGTISGIVDFSDLTLVGDPMVDLISLAIFARDDEGRDLINSLLRERHSERFELSKRLYSLFYAFRFSGCKAKDPETYEWCLGQFRAYSSSK